MQIIFLFIYLVNRHFTLIQYYYLILYNSIFFFLPVFKEQIFVVGNDVTLWCTDNATDVKLNEFIYVVWNMSMQGKKCYLGLSHKRDDTCNDGKKLNNTSFSLFIPNISMEDEGYYLCDLSYKGGSNAVNISVSGEYKQNLL